MAIDKNFHFGYSLSDNNGNRWTTCDVHALERDLTEEQAWSVLVYAKISDDDITSDLLDNIILTYIYNT